jgi:hypothetical protein
VILQQIGPDLGTNQTEEEKSFDEQIIDGEGHHSLASATGTTSNATR